MEDPILTIYSKKQHTKSNETKVWKFGGQTPHSFLDQNAKMPATRGGGGVPSRQDRVKSQIKLGGEFG